MTYRQLFALIGLIGFGTASLAGPEPRTVAPVVDAGSGQLYGAAAGAEWLSARDAEAFMKKGLAFRAYAKEGSFLKKTVLSPARTSEILLKPHLPSNKEGVTPPSFRHSGRRTLGCGSAPANPARQGQSGLPRGGFKLAPGSGH